MLIRFNKKSKPVEISSDEFDELVKKGKLTPKSLVKNKFIAKGKWVSIDNMKRFHRNSPFEYPPGPYLIQERAIEARRKKQKAELYKLEENYNSGMMIEQYFELISLKNLCLHYKVPTASRLTVMPALHPELVITLLFGLDSISINIIKGKTSVWQAIPRLIELKVKKGLWVNTAPIPFDLAEASKVSTELSYSEKIYPFNNISLFLDLAREAVSCYSPATDGVAFRHEVVSDRTDIYVLWSNPSDREYPTQCHLISSYSDLVREAMLKIEDGKDSNGLKKSTSWGLLVKGALNLDNELSSRAMSAVKKHPKGLIALDSKYYGTPKVSEQHKETVKETEGALKLDEKTECMVMRELNDVDTVVYVQFKTIEKRWSDVSFEGTLYWFVLHPVTFNVLHVKEFHYGAF